MEIDNKEFEELNSEVKLFTNDIEQNIITITEIIYFFLRKKVTILLNFVILTAIFLGFLFTIPDYYIVNVSFVPPPPDIITKSSDSLLTFSSGSPLDFASKLSLVDPSLMYEQILESKVVRQDIINKLNLMTVFKTKYRVDALKILEKMTTIKPSSGLMQISVKYKDPKLAADIANEYLEQLTLVINRLSFTEIKKGRIFLEQRLSQIHNKLYIANKRLKDYKVNKKMVNLESQSKLIIGEITEIKDKIFNMEMELTTLRATYTDNYQKIKALKAGLRALKEELNKKMRGGSLPINSEGPGDNVSFLDIPGVNIDYTELAREVAILEEVYLLLTKEYELAKLKEAKETINIKIIEKAIVPDKRDNFPNRLLIPLIAIIAFIISLGISFIQYSLTKINNFSPENYRIITRLKNDIKNELLFWK